VKRLVIGPGGSNIGFSKDGRTAFIALTGANAVAVIDMEKLTPVGQIRAGVAPQGLIVR
jgi:DNA-binding beta-propeller fold protein YncE